MYKNNIYRNELSLFFKDYIIWIAEVCKDKNIEKIFFFTREGVFFKQIYDKLKDLNEQLSWPSAEILEVSRVSTFALSVGSVDTESFMRMWTLYKTQSVRAFLLSLGEEPEDYQDLIGRCGLRPEEPVEEPWSDERIKRFLDDSETKAKLQTGIDAKKRQLYRYFEEKGWNRQKQQRFAVVDIGWRGTIQDNICLLFPHTAIEGFYLSLAPFLNCQPANAVKHGFLDRNSSRIVLRYPTPVEMLCNTSGGSVAGYDKGRAIRICEEGEESVFRDFTGYAQQEIIRGINVHNMKQPGDMRALDHLLLNPEKRMVKAFFSLKHNELFGAGEITDKKRAISKKYFIKALYSGQARRELKMFLWKTSWPQGYLVLQHMRTLVRVYNYILKKEFIDGQDNRKN